MAFDDEGTLRIKFDAGDMQKQVSAIAQQVSSSGQTPDMIAIHRKVFDDMTKAADALTKIELEKMRIQREILKISEMTAERGKKELEGLDKKLAMMKQINDQSANAHENIDNFIKEKQDDEWADRMRPNAYGGRGTVPPEEARKIEAADLSAQLRAYAPVFNKIASIGNNVGGAMQQSAWQGGTTSSAYGVIGAGLSEIPLIGSALAVYPNQMAAEERRSEERSRLRFGLFQSGGKRAYDAFEHSESITETDSRGVDARTGGRSFFEDLGVTPQQKASLIGGAEHVGVSGLQSQNELGTLQGIFGLGQEGLGAMGAAKRAGATDEKAISLLGSSLSLGVKTGLEQGRLFESFALVSKSMDSATHGMLNVTTALGVNEFIGGMGGAFRGDTAAAAGAQGALAGMASGAYGGGSEVFAVTAEMEAAPGLNWFAAKARANRPLAERGGAVINATVDKFLTVGGIRAAIASGDDIQIENAVMAHAQWAFPGMSEADKNFLIPLLKRRAGGGDVAAGGAITDLIGHLFGDRLKKGKRAFEAPAEEMLLQQRGAIGEQVMEGDVVSKLRGVIGDAIGGSVGRWIAPDEAVAPWHPAYSPVPAPGASKGKTGPASTPGPAPAASPAPTPTAATGPGPLTVNDPKKPTGAGRIDVFIHDNRVSVATNGPGFQPAGLVHTTGTV